MASVSLAPFMCCTQLRVLSFVWISCAVDVWDVHSALAFPKLAFCYSQEIPFVTWTSEVKSIHDIRIKCLQTDIERDLGTHLALTTTRHSLVRKMEGHEENILSLSLTTSLSCPETRRVVEEQWAFWIVLENSSKLPYRVLGSSSGCSNSPQSGTMHHNPHLQWASMPYFLAAFWREWSAIFS